MIMTVLSIMCTSRGTALLTENEMIFVGEVVSPLSQYKNKQLVLNTPISEYVLYAGGWQYLITRKIADKKSLQFFLKSISKLAHNQTLSDIEISTQTELYPAQFDDDMV